jgi:large subunit ribosomal protein L10
MEKAEKIAKSDQLKAELDGINALVLVEFGGLTVLEVNELRTKFRDAGCTYKVYKNTTIKYAVQGTTHEPILPFLKGVTGLAYNAEDPGAPARVAKEYASDNDKLTVKGGAIDGKPLDPAGVETLASMLGPLELKAQLLALFNTPATQLVRVLNAPAQNLLNVLNAKKDKDAA